MSAYTPAGRRYSLRLLLRELGVTMDRCQELGLWVTLLTAHDDIHKCASCWKKQEKSYTTCCEGKCGLTTCDECLEDGICDVCRHCALDEEEEEHDCGDCADGTHILCFNCDEHFTGDQESDDFLNWEYCAGRKDWACCAECRYEWDEPCDDDSCVYCGNCEDSEPAHRCDKCNIEFVEDDNDFCGFKPFHIDVWWCESCWYDEYKCEPTRDGE